MHLTWTPGAELPILRVEGSSDVVAGVRIEYRWVIDGASVTWDEERTREPFALGQSDVLFVVPLATQPPIGAEGTSLVPTTTSAGQVRVRVVAFSRVGAELYRATAPLLDASFRVTSGSAVATHAQVQEMVVAADGSIRATDPAVTVEVSHAP